MRCPDCGKEIDERCPICNAVLTDKSKKHIEKHIRRCAVRLKVPYLYSDNKRGRPSNKERDEQYKAMLEDDE